MTELINVTMQCEDVFAGVCNKTIYEGLNWNYFHSIWLVVILIIALIGIGFAVYYYDKYKEIKTNKC